MAVQGQVALIHFSFDLRVLEVHKRVHFEEAELELSCTAGIIFLIIQSLLSESRILYMIFISVDVVSGSSVVDWFCHFELSNI